MPQGQEHAAEVPSLLADRRERLITRILFCTGVILLAALPIYVAVARGTESSFRLGTLQVAEVAERDPGGVPAA